MRHNHANEEELIMIYSRFGSEVKQVLGFNEEAMTLTVVFEDSRDGKPEKVSIADLKADNGIAEITERGKSANSVMGNQHV